jgi:hypothetical protein
MARKSQARRSQEAQELVTKYGVAGFGENEWAVRFLNSIIDQISRGRYLSKKQRDMVDNMVHEGVPTPKGDTTLLAKMDAAVKYWTATNERQWECGVISDMRRRVFSGWSMSTKQAKLLDDLIQRHQDDITGANVFTPTAEQLADLEALVKLYNGYSGQWQAERPAVQKAIQKVTDMLAGTGTIEEYHYNKLAKSLGAKLRRFKAPRHAACDMGKLVDFVNNAGMREKVTHLITAMSDAYINDRGLIVNDWMLPTGEVRTIDQDQIKFFGRSRKKSA